MSCEDIGKMILQKVSRTFLEKLLVTNSLNPLLVDRFVEMAG